MTVPEFAVHRRVTVVMLTCGAILLGTIASTRLPQELFPPIAFPQVTVVTEYPNAAPEEIETLVTRPLEEAVGSVLGLKRLESVSQVGRSTILVSFDWGQDIDFAALAVREKIDLVKERLPRESGDPVVLKFDPLARPILILSVTGEMKSVQLKAQVERILKDNLAKVEGVASVNVSGGLDREILLDVDQARLQASSLSILELVDALEKANVSYPAGGIKKGLYEYLIRTVGEFRSVKEIAYSVVQTDVVEAIRQESRPEFMETGSPGPRKTIDTLREELAHGREKKRLVLVKDVADTKDTVSEKTSISRYRGKENISVSLQKQAGANTIQVVDRVKKILAMLQDELETRKVKAEIIYDHSIFIRQSLTGLRNSALEGFFLAFLVLFVFLRNVVSSLVVAGMIPITAISVFFIMQVQGLSLNMMSLGGLALAIGSMIDVAIVALENIFRLRQMGMKPIEGAIKGTQEVFWPIFSSGLTNIAVFFPLLLFVPGVAGQLFKDLSWACIHANVVSTILAVSLVTLLSVYARPQHKEYRPLDWLKGLEARVLGLKDETQQNWLLGRILLVAIASAVVGILLMTRLDKEVLPKTDQGIFVVKIDMPIGTRLEITDEITTLIENLLLKIPDVDSTAVIIGSSKGKKEEVKIESLRPSQGAIVVSLKKDRKRRSSAVVDEFREKLEGYNLRGARVEPLLQESEFQFAASGAKPILIEIKGFEFEKTAPLAQEIKNKLGQIPNVTDIQDDVGERSPETKLEIDKKRASLYGISALDISLTAKVAIDGVVATTYREGGREYDIRVRLNEKDRQRMENLGDLLMHSGVLDAMIPLKEVATVKQGTGPSEIRRKDQERTIIVSADIKKGAKQAKVLEEVQKMLRTVVTSQDYSVVLSGQAREVRESFRKVYFAIFLAVLFNYMIMAAQFESITQPLLILITIPLSMIGISLAMMVMGTSLNVVSLLGMVMLAGLVVNNGIVLIEFINQRRAEGVPLVEAAFEATKVRTRPILMSALTNVFGMIPIALGLEKGSELMAPLAVATIGGLLSSTILTLVVLPGFYILSIRFVEKMLGQVEE